MLMSSGIPLDDAISSFRIALSPNLRYADRLASRFGALSASYYRTFRQCITIFRQVTTCR